MNFCIRLLLTGGLLLTFVQSPFLHVHPGDDLHEHAPLGLHIHLPEAAGPDDAIDSDRAASANGLNMSASASSEEDVQFLDWLAEIERAGGFDALPEGSVAEPVLAASAAVVRETWTRVHDPPRATLLPSRAPPA